MVVLLDGLLEIGGLTVGSGRNSRDRPVEERLDPGETTGRMHFDLLERSKGLVRPGRTAVADARKFFSDHPFDPVALLASPIEERRRSLFVLRLQ